MQLMKVDPRALKDNPDNTRQSKSTPQADALLLATIKAVGVIQPPVIFAEAGGNGYVIEAGHRRTRMAIAAGIEEIDVIVVEAANDNGAMRSMIENIAREPLNPVDQWRGIERLIALGWTEEAIAIALALPVRQIRKLRLLANVLPAMLDHMARGDMPSEQQLRTISAASLDEQKEVWKAHKPKKGDTASWWAIATGLTKTRMFARDASFGDDLRQACGIEWAEDLFGPADEDNRFTSNVETFLGAQQEWMSSNLPTKGSIVELTSRSCRQRRSVSTASPARAIAPPCISIERARCSPSTSGCPRRRRRTARPIRPRPAVRTETRPSMLQPRPVPT